MVVGETTMTDKNLETYRGDAFGAELDMRQRNVKDLTQYQRLSEIFKYSATPDTTIKVIPHQVKFIKADPEAKLPYKASKGAACSDIYSIEYVSIEQGETKIIDTGLKVAHVPQGHKIAIYDRSGFRAKGIFGSSTGIIDEDYKGQLKVILYNSTKKTVEITPGDRVAQIELVYNIPVEYSFTDFAEETERGEGGFGSTGSK